jgi:hypothetical protein
MITAHESGMIMVRRSNKFLLILFSGVDILELATVESEMNWTSSCVVMVQKC